RRSGRGGLAVGTRACCLSSFRAGLPLKWVSFVGSTIGQRVPTARACCVRQGLSYIERDGLLRELLAARPGSAGQESTRYTAVASSLRLVLGHWRPSGSMASAARTWRRSSSGPLSSRGAGGAAQVASPKGSTSRLAPSLSSTARWRRLLRRGAGE